MEILAWAFSVWLSPTLGTSEAPTLSNMPYNEPVLATVLSKSHLKSNWKHLASLIETHTSSVRRQHEVYITISGVILVRTITPTGISHNEIYHFFFFFLSNYLKQTAQKISQTEPKIYCKRLRHRFYIQTQFLLLLFCRFVMLLFGSVLFFSFCSSVRCYSSCFSLCFVSVRALRRQPTKWRYKLFSRN